MIDKSCIDLKQPLIHDWLPFDNFPRFFSIFEQDDSVEDNILPIGKNMFIC